MSRTTIAIIIIVAGVSIVAGIIATPPIRMMVADADYALVQFAPMIGIGYYGD
jgi:hypothetical protein